MRIKGFLILASVLGVGVVIGHLQGAMVLADDAGSSEKARAFTLENCVTEFSEDRVQKTEKTAVDARKNIRTPRPTAVGVVARRPDHDVVVVIPPSETY